eukprot:s663_g18.t1
MQLAALTAGKFTDWSRAMIESSPKPVPLLGPLSREAPEELLGDPVIGDLVLARFDNTQDFYWAKVADISGHSRDVEWLRPLAGQPGSPLYACSNGCDDTQGRSGLRPEDVRFPMPEELASDSAPPVPSAEFMHSDIADEDVVTLQYPATAPLNPKGPGACLWQGDLQDFRWTSTRTVDDFCELPGRWFQAFLAYSVVRDWELDSLFNGEPNEHNSPPLRHDPCAMVRCVEAPLPSVLKRSWSTEEAMIITIHYFSLQTPNRMADGMAGTAWLAGYSIHTGAGSTRISFFLAFFGWFALTPVALEVATSIGICENQLFPPEKFPNRPAYLTYKDLNSGLTYCSHGVRMKGGQAIDCEVPTSKTTSVEDVDDLDLSADRNAELYRPETLADCVCTPGTTCRSVISKANIASVAGTILLRVALGTILERFGPVNVQCGLMFFGAFWVAMSAAINSSWTYIFFRFCIGLVGAAFVTNQFWCSLMFAPNVIGTANATAAGWGNTGGGVTQIFMIAVLFKPMVDAGLTEDTAWRVSMAVPAMMMISCAICMKFLCWDMPTGKNYDPRITGKTRNPSVWDYWEVLKDFRVVVMIFQYSACFGCELAMNNQLATHFRTYFQLAASDASLLAGSFGMMNLFARSTGGILSDLSYKYMGFPGRIWVQFLFLTLESVFLFAFGNIDKEKPWYLALAMLVGFSLFVQMAEGTSYGMVPFMNREQLAVVSALVGAGGNVGAVIAGYFFYDLIEDELLPFRVRRQADDQRLWAILGQESHPDAAKGHSELPQADVCRASGGPRRLAPDAATFATETAGLKPRQHKGEQTSTSIT